MNEYTHKRNAIKENIQQQKTYNVTQVKGILFWIENLQLLFSICDWISIGTNTAPAPVPHHKQ